MMDFAKPTPRVSVHTLKIETTDFTVEPSGSVSHLFFPGFSVSLLETTTT